MAGWGKRGKGKSGGGSERAATPAPPPRAVGSDPELSALAKKAFDAMGKTEETLQDMKKMAEDPAKYLREQKKKEKQKKENAKTVLKPPEGAKSAIKSTALLRNNQENKFDRETRKREKLRAEVDRATLEARFAKDRAKDASARADIASFRADRSRSAGQNNSVKRTGKPLGKSPVQPDKPAGQNSIKSFKRKKDSR